ncbi:AAA family ATPase [Nocardia sp. NPDC023988]|uniref:KGGVGR-motif variant AAA ATPase n=1 Tax=unclassified Nocardia TaxID=2637762 RepID=UPI0033C7478C
MNVTPEPLRFDDVIPRARLIAEEVAATGLDVVIVRDIVGRVSLLVDDRTAADMSDDSVESWTCRLVEELGLYAGEEPMVFASGLFLAEQLLSRASFGVVPGQSSASGRVGRIENTVVGQDWAQVRAQRAGTAPRRVALYGFKGGVGRSTATAMLARHLADQGKCVLVVDLDLESPGSGPMLLTAEDMPTYGVVDQLVESAVDNADGLDLVVAASGFTARGNGEIWVAPARGIGKSPRAYSYVDKLNRVYGEFSGGELFADRMEAAVSACEKMVTMRSRRPDIVLLDSRAGLHDLAAVTISKLSDIALLFGADNSQTWDGYHDLFKYWCECGQAETVRDKLQMVASMVPDRRGMSKDQYLSSFVERSWTCFSTLYDDVSGADPLGYNPSPEDVTGPHYPIPILFTQDLVGIDAVSTEWVHLDFVQVAYSAFLSEVTNLIGGEL